MVTPESLTPTVMALLQDDAERERLGERALGVMQVQKGATTRTVAALLTLLHTESVLRTGETVAESQV